MQRATGTGGKAAKGAHGLGEGFGSMPQGFDGDFDAVLNGEGQFAGSCYLFKGDSYLKFDWASRKAAPGYPKKIAGNWPGLPSLFHSDLDAAINGEGAFAGNCYFFKGDSYVKFDWAKDHAVYDAPKKIAGNWPGFPAGFEGDLDAALNGRGVFAGKAYFFKGDSYIRFDWKNDHADPGYPRKIAEGWDLHGGFANGVDAALEGVGTELMKAYFFKGRDFVRYDWELDRADE
jgi:hypothetical protein